MIAAWMVYAVLVAGLLGTAALALELALRLAGRQARWVWVLALTASLGLPVLALGPAPPASGADVGLVVTAARAVSAPVPDPSPALVSLDTPLVAAWIAASVLMLGILLRAQWTLRRVLAAGETRDIDGHRVRVTPACGPAVLGGWGPATIVLPVWVTELDPEHQRLAVRHEAEHVAAGDVRLLAAAGLAAVACPWNPLIWWQLHRLRDAVELDCDRRLVRAGVDVRAYGTLLLDVARRAPMPRPALALAARPSLLSRRIDHMTPLPSRTRGLRALVGAALAVVLVALACEAPGPPTAGTLPVLDVAAVDVPPVRLSSPLVPYPPLLRDAGIEGDVVLEFVVDTAGRVDSTSIVVVSSNHPAFERPAVDLIAGSRFRPAMLNGVATAVRTRQPIKWSIASPRPDSGAVQIIAVPAAPSGR